MLQKEKHGKDNTDSENFALLVESERRDTQNYYTFRMAVTLLIFCGTMHTFQLAVQIISIDTIFTFISIMPVF